jgi:hypothetical protein
MQMRAHEPAYRWRRPEHPTETELATEKGGPSPLEAWTSLSYGICSDILQNGAIHWNVNAGSPYLPNGSAGVEGRKARDGRGLHNWAPAEPASQPLIGELASLPLAALFASGGGNGRKV